MSHLGQTTKGASAGALGMPLFLRVPMCSEMFQKNMFRWNIVPNLGTDDNEPIMDVSGLPHVSRCGPCVLGAIPHLIFTFYKSKPRLPSTFNALGTGF